MYISPKQKKVVEQIKQLMEWKETKDRNVAFIQAEIPNLTMHTIDALKEKGFIDESENPFGIKVYKWTGKEIE